jgi:hypothetical protein
MGPKHHPTPLSGGLRSALTKELAKTRGMTVMLAQQAGEMRALGEDLIRQADKMLSESWNERMWTDGEPIAPSPTVNLAITPQSYAGLPDHSRRMGCLDASSMGRSKKLATPPNG